MPTSTRACRVALFAALMSTLGATAADARLKLDGLSGAEQRTLRTTASVLAIRRTAPAVIAITSTQVRKANPYVDTPWGRYLRPDLEPKVKQSLGSGVIVDPRGYAITNEHVVSQATRIKVKMANGRVYQAKVVAAAPSFDLAVLKIQSNARLPAAPLGDSSRLMHGETAIAIGNPFGLSQTVSRGVISSTSRTFHTRSRSYVNFIQTDAAINPGNSGGPLINLVGKVIGINTLGIRGGQNLSLTIPVNVVKVVMADLLKYGQVRFPYLGLRVGPIRGLGVKVIRVVTDGPAARAGIRTGDVIRTLRGFVVADHHIFWRLTRSLIPGQRITLGLKRGEVRLVVGGTKRPPPASASRAFERALGVTLGNASEYVTHFRLQTRRGVILLKAQRGAKAWRRNLRRGDVITAIGRTRVSNVNDLNRRVRKLVRGHQFTLTVMRRNKTYTFSMRY